MHLRVNVVLVQLNVAVTDDKGNYVTGLRPEDFTISEDKLPQKISTFEESSDPDKSSSEIAPRGRNHSPNGPAAQEEGDGSGVSRSTTNLMLPHLSEASLFILFDTSNYMYRSFVYAQDAIVRLHPLHG